MHLNIKPLLDEILTHYLLHKAGIHGVAHWARVLENGLRLAAQTGAQVSVVTLFAVLHDSQRENEGYDVDHGPRAAEFAARLRGEFFELRDEEFENLHVACAGHTHVPTHPDPTIQTCWDADRLDLGRVGITPLPSRLCTAAARDPRLLHWADDRACRGVVPDLVRHTWGLDV